MQYWSDIASPPFPHPCGQMLQQLMPVVSYVCSVCRADKAQIMKISADNVRLSITHGISHEDASEELLEFVRGILGVRLSQLSVMRGESTRHKLVLVKDVPPATVFDKLQAHFEKHKK